MAYRHIVEVLRRFLAWPRTCAGQVRALLDNLTADATTMSEITMASATILIAPAPRAVGRGGIHCRDRLGGLLRYYYQAA